MLSLLLKIFLEVKQLNFKIELNLNISYYGTAAVRSAEGSSFEGSLVAAPSSANVVTKEKICAAIILK